MPRRNTRTKAPKDLNAPKRPVSGYMLFSQKRMKTLRTEQPDKKVTELTKVIGAEWKTMSQEAKTPFETEARELKEKFKVAMAEYQESDLHKAFQTKLKRWKEQQRAQAAESKQADEDDDDEDEMPAVPVKVQKRPKDPNAPKKPQSGYFLYASSRRAAVKEANPQAKMTEIAKIVGAEWKALSDEAKQPFLQDAQEKKAAYNVEFAAYKETEDYKKHQAALAVWKASQKKAKSKPAPRKKATKEKKPSNRATEADDDDEDESESDSDSSVDELTEQRTASTTATTATSSRNFEGSSSEEESESDDDDEDDDVEMAKNTAVRNEDEEDDEDDDDMEE